MSQTPKSRTTTGPSIRDESRLAAAVEEYLAALERGEAPARSEFLARHADLADVLPDCLDGLQFICAAGAALDSSRDPQEAPPKGGEESSPFRLLGDYRIIREIGRGGMGVVYEAEQISLGRRVALKILPFADPKQLQRFQNEARAAAQLHHTNIVPIISVGCDRGVNYYAMQYIEGQTLAVVIRQLRQIGGLEATEESFDSTGPDSSAAGSTPAPPGLVDDHSSGWSVKNSKSREYFRAVAALGIRAAEALEYAHSLGVIHRDIKPSNLLLDARGELWITDFGLAHVESNPALTMTGDLLGTLRYMSPEHATGGGATADRRVDIYSLGVTLYELLTLEPAFAGRNRHELLRQVGCDEPRPPRRINSAIPAELETILLKAVSKDPAQRYATAQQLADDLRRFLEDKPIRAKRPTLPQRLNKWARRHKPLVTSLAIFLALLLVALILGSLAFGFKQRQLADRREAIVQEQERMRMKTEAQLYRALLDRAAALRLARQPGYRTEVFKDLHQAAALNVPEKSLEEIKNEVVACLGDPIGLEPIEHPSAERRAQPETRQVFQTLTRDSPTHSLVSAATRDGQMFARAEDAADIVSLWGRDGNNVKSIGRVTSQVGGVGTLQFSSDGKSLAASCTNGFVVWTVPDLRTRTSVQGGAVTSVAIHPNGQIMLAGGARPELWSLSSNRLIASFNNLSYSRDGPSSTIEKFEFSADGQFLLRVSPDNKVISGFSISATPEKLSLIDRQAESSAGGVAFSPDGRKLVTSNDAVLEIWDAHTGALLQDCHGKGGGIFSPDGELLASFQEPRNGLQLWDPASGASLIRVPDAPPIIWQIEFDRSGKFIVVAGATTKENINSAAVIAWKITHPTPSTVALEPFAKLPLQSFAYGPGGLRDLAIHPDGTRLIFSDYSGTTYTYDLLHATGLRPITQGAWQAHTLHFDPSGRYFRFFTKDHTIGRCDLEEGAVVKTTPKKDSSVLVMAFTSDDRWAAFASADNHTVIYDLQSDRELLRLPADSSNVYSLCWSRDGTRLAVGLSDACVIWDLEQVRAQLLEFGITIPSTATNKSVPAEPEPISETSFAQMGQLNKRRQQADEYKVEADAAARAHRPEDAEAALRHACEVYRDLASEFPQVLDYQLEMGARWGDLAHLYQAADQPKKAEEAYRQAIAQHAKLVAEAPSDRLYRRALAFEYNNLGILLDSEGRPEEAEADLRQAMTINTSLASANDADHRNTVHDKMELIRNSSNLGFHLYKALRLDAAESILRQAAKLTEELKSQFPDSKNYPTPPSSLLADINWLLGPVLVEADREPEAEQAFRTAVLLAPQNAHTHARLAWFLVTRQKRQAHDEQEAFDLATKATALEPGELWGWAALGVAHYRMGDPTSAVEALHKSLDLDKNGLSVRRFVLAMAHWQLGHKDEARRWYNEGIQKVAEAKQMKWPGTDTAERFAAEAEKLLNGNGPTTKPVALMQPIASN